MLYTALPSAFRRRTLSMCLRTISLLVTLFRVRVRLNSSTLTAIRKCTWSLCIGVSSGCACLYLPSFPQLHIRHPLEALRNGTIPGRRLAASPPFQDIVAVSLTLPSPSQPPSLTCPPPSSNIPFQSIHPLTQHNNLLPQPPRRIHPTIHIPAPPRDGASSRPAGPRTV
jgi:hypothetical protein